MLKSIPYSILACQSRLQKSHLGCNIFAFLLSGELSKTSFAELAQYGTVTESVTFHCLDNDHFVPPRGEELPSVTWIPITSFGERVIKMGQSKTDMLKNLFLKNRSKAESQLTIKNWMTIYDIDRSKRQYYFDYRLRSLQHKYETEDPYEGLTEEKVLGKFKVSPNQVITKEEALMLQAGGYSSMREMRFLIQRMTPEEINTRIPSYNYVTALFIAISQDRANRALLLLRHGARSDIPSESGVTAEQIFPQTCLKDHPVVAKLLTMNNKSI
jgi:hypothetical protein